MDRGGFVKEILRCSGRPVPSLQGTHEDSLSLSLPEASSELELVAPPASGRPHYRLSGCVASHLESEKQTDKGSCEHKVHRGKRTATMLHKKRMNKKVNIWGDEQFDRGEMESRKKNY